MRMRRRGFELARAVALLTLGALALHQLRYLIAFGPASGEALHREGHGYLAQTIPVIVALAAATLAASVLLGALRAPRQASRPGIARALFYGAALFAVFAAQELAEGALAPGHPAGIAALVSGGAWVAVPLAVVLGCAAALAERLLVRADAVLALALASARGHAAAPEPGPPTVHLPRTPLTALPLAFGLARRPPPTASIA
jgi:hypothetical protein